MWSFDIRHGMDALICLGVQHFEFVVFFPRQEKALALDVRREVIKVAVLQAGQWNRRYQLQRSLILCRCNRWVRNENREKKREYAVHACLSDQIRFWNWAAK